ncbi:PHP domain-containing protein [Patescibacteria group bacterium]
MRNIQTLHSHTINSDGALTHEQALKVCENNGISTLAFTDHDGVIDKKSLLNLKKYKGHVRWISGIEISSGLPIELGGKATSNLHIVGLFVDPTNKNLVEHCELAKDARITRMQKMVKNLKELGFDISEEDCIKASGGESVGRPHVVSALKSKSENLTIIEDLRLKMKADAKNNSELKKRYNSMMEQGERQYPYQIFLSDDAYLPGVYVDYQYFLDMDYSVKLIRDAGGLAILAHYFTCARNIDESMLDGMLRDNRLNGLETLYGFFALTKNEGTDIEKTIRNTQDIAKKLTAKHDKLESGGVDAHLESDFENFANSSEYSNKSIGMVEKIIEKSGVNTTWSNIE